MPTPCPERTNDSPTCSIKHDFCADDAVEKRRANPLSLRFRCKAILTQAIADESAEKRLAATVANCIAGISCMDIVGTIRRPNNVEPGPKLHVPDFLTAWLLPDHQPSHPKPRSFVPRRWRNRQGLGSEQIMLLRH
jgi:hypothetical protein